MRRWGGRRRWGGGEGGGDGEEVSVEEMGRW